VIGRLPGRVATSAAAPFTPAPGRPAVRAQRQPTWRLPAGPRPVALPRPYPVHRPERRPYTQPRRGYLSL